MTNRSHASQHHSHNNQPCGDPACHLWHNHPSNSGDPPLDHRRAQVTSTRTDRHERYSNPQYPIPIGGVPYTKKYGSWNDDERGVRPRDLQVDSSRYSSSTRPNARPNTVQYSHYPTTDDAQHEGRVPITSGHRFLGGRHQGERLQNYLQEEDGHLYGTLYGATSRQREQRLQDVETRYREALGLPIPRSSQSDAFIDSEPHMVPREDNRNRPPPEGSWGSTPHHGPEMDTRPGRSRNGEDEDRNPSRYNASEGYSPFGGHHRYD